MQERALERKLHVHEKSTYASRMNEKLASVRKTALTPESSNTDIKGFEQASRLHENTQYVLATTRGRTDHAVMPLILCVHRTSH